LHYQGKDAFMNITFLCGRFRSGSTFLWNIYRQVPEVTAYYEPLHEQLLQYIRTGVTPQAKHFFVDEYFREFLSLEELKQIHYPDFGVTRLYLESQDSFPRLKIYLEYLILHGGIGKKVIIKENRLDLRIRWLRQNFPSARVLYLFRSPRDEWISMTTDCPFDVGNDIESNPYLITTWARDLSWNFPFLASQNIHHLYQRHYFLWKLSYLMGIRQADFSIRYEDILATPDKKIADLLRFAGLDVDTNLDKCLSLVVQRPTDVWKKYASGAWFDELEQECEHILDAYGINENFGLMPLEKFTHSSKTYQGFDLTILHNWSIQSAQLEIERLKIELQRKEIVIQELKDELPRRLEAMRSISEEAVKKEKVIQSFRTSPYYWLVYGPIFRFIPFLNLVKRARKWKRDYFWDAPMDCFSPKLGILRQYQPRKVIIPARYLQTLSPSLVDLPKISIVTPSYNQEMFIERTIKSVMNQNYSNLEYIVQDGGSTDGTVKILERYSANLTYWASQADGGQANAINKGFQYATGGIMGWLNSDDMLVPGALHYIANYFIRHPEVDVVYGHRIIIDEQDLEIGRWVLPPHNTKAVLYGDYIPQETLFWRRCIWDRVGGTVDETFEFALDWDLILRFQAAGAVFKCLPRFLGMFRVHPKQKTTVLIETIGKDEMDRLRIQYSGQKGNHFDAPNIMANYLDWSRYLGWSVIYHNLYCLGILRY